MNCRVTTIVAVLAWAGQACSSHSQPWPVDCPPSAPAGAETIRARDLGFLAGRFEVTLVALSYGRQRSFWRGDLSLAPTDTLRRYYIQTIRGWLRQGERPLAGRFSYANDSLRRGEDAEVEDGVLFLGCRRCMDASPDELRLLAATPTEVWGLWYNPQSSFERVTDSAGNPLPNPAGHFCMRRLAS